MVDLTKLNIFNLEETAYQQCWLIKKIFHRFFNKTFNVFLAWGRKD